MENLCYINDCGKKIEVRIPYVPDYNSEEIEEVAGFLSGLKNITKVKVLPYHNYAGSKYDALAMENILPERLPKEEDLINAKSILEEYDNQVL